jgi:hypothetical protein
LLKYQADIDRDKRLIKKVTERLLKNQELLERTKNRAKWEGVCLVSNTDMASDIEAAC